MTLVVDAGALVALERNERAMWLRYKAARAAGEVIVTHGGVLGQVWRAHARQARLALALDGVDVRPLDEVLGRRAGRLLGRTGLSDVIDAALVLLATDGDEVVTSDVGDLAELAHAADLAVDLLRP